MTGTPAGAVYGYGIHLPHHRLDRRRIGEVLETGPSGTGTRTVASFDEDATTMAVEAARRVVGGDGPAPDGLYFVTTAPPYLDKTNATAVHAALRLPANAFATDVVGSARNAVTALRSALETSSPRLVVASDVRVGRPGGGDEREGGDGAAAILVGPGGDGAIATVAGFGSATLEFLDRWRTPGVAWSSHWEERFGDHAYGPLVGEAVTDAIKHAGVAADAVDRWVVVGTHTRATRAASKALAGHGGELAADLTSTIGNTGAAHAGIALAAALDEAEAGQTIGLVSVNDGVDVVLLETTDALVSYREGRRTVAEQIAAGDDSLAYSTYLTWRGLLDREPPRRPDPKRPAPPPSLRSVDWKYGLVGSRCTACGTRNLPAQRTCVSCQAVDRMEPAPMADVPATVATFTLDRLTYSLNPPVVAAVLDFDGGGRFTCELTDVDPAEVHIGLRVEMTFRRLHTADGVHNYFWKARPVRDAQA